MSHPTAMLSHRKSYQGIALLRRRIFLIMTGVISLFSPSDVSATGPASMFISIQPVAISEAGALLFKTSSGGNPSGAHSLLALHAEYGWLCIDPNYGWHEETFVDIDWETTDIPEDLPLATGEEIYVRRYRNAADAYEESVDLESPPPELAALMKTCSKGSWRPVDQTTGRGRATWSPTRFCLDGRCLDESIHQKTLGARINESGTGTVESSFLHGRVAVFGNIDDYEENLKGAFFPIENESCRGCGFEIMSVTGISLIPESLLEVD